MPIFARRTHSGRPRAALLVALLLLTLSLAGVLAYQAQDAARSHRAAAESALRDYAAFAAWEFRREARTALSCALHQALHPIAYDNAHVVDGWYPGPMPGPADARSPEACTCGFIRARYYFRLDLRDGGLVTSGQAPAPAVRAWIAEALPGHVRDVYRSNWDAALIGVVDGLPRLLVYHVARDGEGEPTAVLGLGTELAALAPAFERIHGSATLLPPSLIGGIPNDSLLSIEVAAAGHLVFRSPTRYPARYVAEDTLGVQYGGLTARVSLRPAAAEQLVIGGLPRSRLPVVLGLLALTAGLVFVALRQLRREYELARLRADFVSGTSHELRTPLAQIRMFAETLLLGRVRSEEERQRSAEIIVQEARRLTHLVENVLHFSRAERRRGRIDPEPTELASLIREVVETFAPLARPRAVDLRAEVEEKVIASVDRDALRQMLLNLLDNAVKYGPRGQTVTIALSYSDGRARIRVEDEGPGIPPRERERVWESFSRLERDAESAVAGSGIGLAVVRELATLHGGRAWVEATRGGGACFVIEVPGAGRPSGGVEAGAERAERPTEVAV